MPGGWPLGSRVTSGAKVEAGPWCKGGSVTTGARPRPRAGWVGVKNREVKLASRARKHQNTGHWDLIELNLGCIQKVHAGCMLPTRGGNRIQEQEDEVAQADA